MPHVETFLDGVWYPSATTILSAQSKPWLDKWRNRWGIRAERKTAIATAIGTAFHDCIEQSLDGIPWRAVVPLYPSCERRVHRMMVVWAAWCETINGTIDLTEFRVISRKYVYSGTLDAVGKIGGKTMLIDWKTSSGIYPDMSLQLVAYAQAYNEMTGSKVKNGLIVHVSKDRPHKLTTKLFKLGNREFSKFLKLRRMFDSVVLKGEPLK